MLKAFFRDGLIYTIPSIITRGLGIILIPLYTRVLNPADYGSLDLLTAFTGIVNLTIALEVSQGVARFYSTEEEPQKKILYASSGFWFTFFCYSLFAVGCQLFASQLSPLIMGQENLDNAFRLGVMSIWLHGIFYLVQNQFRWELRRKEYAVISLFMSFITMGGAFLFAYVLNWGIEGLILGNILGFVFGLVVGLGRMRNTFHFNFDFQLLKEMLAFSTFMVFSSIAVWVNMYVSRVMLNYYLSVEEVGLYGIGFRVANIAGLVMICFQSQLTPLIYAYHAHPETPRNLAKIFSYFMSVALLGFIGLSLFATDILRVMTTEQYLGGASVVVFLVPAMFLSNMYIFMPGISLAKKSSYFVWINVCAALLNILLNATLIPILGIIGAGAATLISQSLVFLAHVIFSQKFYPVPHSWKAILLPTAVAVGLVLLIPRLQFDDQTRWLVSILAIGVLAMSFWFFGLIPSEDIRKGWRSISRSNANA